LTTSLPGPDETGVESPFEGAGDAEGERSRDSCVGAEVGSAGEPCSVYCSSKASTFLILSCSRTFGVRLLRTGVGFDGVHVKLACACQSRIQEWYYVSGTCSNLDTVGTRKYAVASDLALLTVSTRQNSLAFLDRAIRVIWYLLSLMPINRRGAHHEQMVTGHELFMQSVSREMLFLLDLEVRDVALTR
jgi:hypothetical protein